MCGDFSYLQRESKKSSSEEVFRILENLYPVTHLKVLRAVEGYTSWLVGGHFTAEWQQLPNRDGPHFPLSTLFSLFWQALPLPISGNGRFGCVDCVEDEMHVLFVCTDGDLDQLRVAFLRDVWKGFPALRHASSSPGCRIRYGSEH